MRAKKQHDKTRVSCSQMKKAKKEAKQALKELKKREKKAQKEIAAELSGGNPDGDSANVSNASAETNNTKSAVIDNNTGMFFDYSR